MNPRFFVDQYRNLAADFDGARETIIVCKFMQNDNVTKCADYLRKMVPELNETFARDFEAGQDLLETIMDKVDEQQGREKRLQEISF